ncbi:MAG TPA: hypothetical protein VFF29_03010, partial [Bacteroidota bacterium]|nr:hypothetical protein [Bacteroidota bacterium]
AQEFYEGTFSRTLIDSADCIVMVGFPSSAASTSMLQEFHDLIVQQKKPVFFINGKTLDYSKLSYIESLLPFSWSSVHTTEMEVFPKIIERHKLHPLVNLDRIVTSETWQLMPPIFKHQTIFREKPEADVLASVKLQLEIGELNEPLLLTKNVNRQRMLGFVGYGIWRWRLLAQGNPQTEPFLPLLMSNAIRWLTTKDEGKHVAVTPVKDAFTSGEPIEFTGQVYDEQFRPVDDANLSLDIVQGNEKFQLAMNAIGSGRYEGFIENLGEGEYTFLGKATKDGKVYGEDKGRFDVGNLNFEFLRTTMNKQLLEQISFTTGAKYYNILHADGAMKEIASQITLTPKENIQTSEIELWNWQYLAAITVLLFGLEWYLRKRNGMI